MGERFLPVPGEVYQHFKGKCFRILFVGKDASDETTDVVIYREVSGGVVFVRKATEFLSRVDKQKYPNCTAQWRFTRV